MRSGAGRQEGHAPAGRRAEQCRDAAMRPDQAGSRERRVGASLSAREGGGGGYAAQAPCPGAYRTYAPGVSHAPGEEEGRRGEEGRRAGGQSRVERKRGRKEGRQEGRKVTLPRLVRRLSASGPEPPRSPVSTYPPCQRDATVPRALSKLFPPLHEPPSSLLDAHPDGNRFRKNIS